MIDHNNPSQPTNPHEERLWALFAAIGFYARRCNDWFNEPTTFAEQAAQDADALMRELCARRGCRDEAESAEPPADDGHAPQGENQ